MKQKRAKGTVDEGARPPTRGRHEALTDAGIVVLFDPAHFASIVDHERWEAALLEDERIAAEIAAGHLVPLSTGADGRYAIDVVVGDALAPDDGKGVTDTSAPYLFVVARTATLGGLEHVYATPDAKFATPLSLVPGRYAVTVHAMKGKGRADVLALLRPLAPGEAFEGRKKIAPFDPKPKKLLGAIKTLPHCQRAVLMGRLDDALKVLPTLADAENDVGAAAMLAEIHAYRGEWSAFLDRAIAVRKRPREVLGNTTDELTWLLVVAGQATGAWDRLAEVASPSSPMVSDQYLCAQIAAKGAAPVVKRDRDERHRHQPFEVRRAHYDKAFEPAIANKRDKTPVARAASEFTFAHDYGLDELALEKLPAAEEGLSWSRIPKTAGFLVEQGRSDDAWRLIERNLGKWWPLSRAQVVPLDLLVDERLRPLLTRERAEKILAMPRGPER